MLDITRIIKRPKNVTALPAKLVHEGNARHLLGSASVLLPLIDASFAAYEKEIGLLRLVNWNADWSHLPSLRLTIEHDGSGASIQSSHCIEPTKSGFDFGMDGPKFTLTIAGQGNNWHCISCNLLPLVSTWPAIELGSHTVYAHLLDCDDPSMQSCRPMYIGVTRRTWEVRYNEHIDASVSGSPYVFHRALRLPARGIVHIVANWGDTYEGAMNLEEAIVGQGTLYPKGLNMIPGGFAGIKYLASRGFECGKQKWEHRHKVVQRFAEHCDRTGQSNPLAALHWRDDDYAASVICSNPRNFTKDQVGEIRLMDSFGQGPSEIAKQMKCAEERVRRLLHGRTYSRVHLH